jgi:hypothetical protein
MRRNETERQEIIVSEASEITIDNAICNLFTDSNNEKV